MSLSQVFAPSRLGSLAYRLAEHYCKRYFIPYSSASLRKPQGLPRLACRALAPPYKLLRLAALPLLIGASLYGGIALLFAISSSSMDSPVTHARLACSLPYIPAICLTTIYFITKGLKLVFKALNKRRLFN